MMPKVGDKIYVPNCSMWNTREGSILTLNGGLATVCDVSEGISEGEPCIFVSVSERTGTIFNWSTDLELQQDILEALFASEPCESSN